MTKRRSYKHYLPRRTLWGWLWLVGAIVGICFEGSMACHAMASPVNSSQNSAAQSTIEVIKSSSVWQPFEKFVLLHSGSQQNEKNRGASEENRKQTMNLQLASIYKTSVTSPRRSATVKHEKSSSNLRKIHLILVGGLLLTIGTIFIPTLIPQIHEYPGKLLPSTRRTAHANGIARKPDFFGSTPSALFEAASANSCLCPEEDALVLQGNDKENNESAPSLDDRVMENAFSDVVEAPDSSVQRVVQQFFEHNGFTFTKGPGKNWIVCSLSPLYDLYGQIPVFVKPDIALTQSDIENLYISVKKSKPSDSKQILFVIVDTPPERTAYQQIYSYKSRCNTYIVLLSLQSITKALRHSTCGQVLEKRLSLALNQDNWYETAGPVDEMLNFFGRKTMMTTLLDSIGHLQHINLLGLRKIGKTSLIWQLRERLDQHIVVYIDLQQLPRDCFYLYRAILDECMREIASKYPTVHLPEFASTSEGGLESQQNLFSTELLKLWNCLRMYRHDIKIVLLLDEADYLVPSSADGADGFQGFCEFIGTIRGMSQQYGFLVSVMVASSPELSRIDTWKGQNNPGFQYYKEVFLSSFAEEGCNQMICHLGALSGVEYTEESLSRIYYETGGHPYVTRQLCSLVFQLKSQAGHKEPGVMKVQVKDVENTVSEYIEYKSDYLESIWNRLSPTEQEILWTITTNNSCALEELITNEHAYSIRRERRKAISTLIENQIIEKCENKYSIRMGLFERFLLAVN